MSRAECGRSGEGGLFTSHFSPPTSHYMARLTPHSALRLEGFTLLELVVVLGVSLMLIALLLPALTLARRSALSVRCRNNLHTIGIAMHGYLLEHHDALPDLDRISPVIGGYIYPFYLFGGKKGLTLDVPPEERFLNAYVGNVEVFHCPMDQPADDFDMDHTYWDDAGNSYLLNTQLPKNNIRLHIFQGRMRNFVREAASLVMVGEEVAFNWLYGYDRGVRWHDPQEPWAHVLFFDGHVRYMLMRPGLKGDGWTFVPSEILEDAPEPGGGTR